MEFNSIGYFQFDNLLQNRVPFLLLMLEQLDVKALYNSMIQLHIENISLTCEASIALESVHTKKLPSHFAIIVLDKDEKKSPRVVKDLEKAGYTNVYYVKNGYDGILTERQQ
ncbi:MAG: rhodanese-like domain-containing protein [Pseudobdellovibrionaceae bacterium]